MWDAGCKLPTLVADGLSRCFCRATVEIKNDVEHHVYGAHLMPLEREVPRSSFSPAPSPTPTSPPASCQDRANGVEAVQGWPHLHRACHCERAGT
jgi:hypothetical protein